MFDRLRRLLVVGMMAAAVLSAADINGKWKGQMPGRNGTREVTFTFKADGGTLTGTMADERGTVNISDGKVTGDSVSFALETQRGKRTMTGTLAGDELKLKREGGQGNAQEFTAKRVQ